MAETTFEKRINQKIAETVEGQAFLLTKIKCPQQAYDFLEKVKIAAVESNMSYLELCGALEYEKIILSNSSIPQTR